MPSLFPASEQELYHKYHFVKEVLVLMGLLLYDDNTTSFTEKFITDIMETPCGHTLMSESNGIAVISTLLIILSILGAFETPTVQACIPTMLQGDNIMKGNAVS